MVESKQQEEVQTLQPMIANQVHVSTRGGLAFFKDKIITAADDTMMKVHTVQPEGADMPLAESEPIDLDGEIFTICSNQVDTIAIGGEDKKAYLQKVEYVEEDGTIKLVEPIEKEIAMCFDTPVMKLQFCAGGKLLGVSQDTHVQIMDIETKKVTSFVKSAHNGSVRNASVDPHFEFLATTGCDGTLKVTSISEQKIVKTCMLTKKSVQLTSNQWLETSWSPSGDYLFVAASTQLSMFKRSENFATQHFLASMSHTKDISMVCASISETCIVTASLDKMVKVWHIPTGSLESADSSFDKITLVSKFKTDNELMELKYNRDQKMLAFLDCECTVGVIYLSGSDALVAKQVDSSVEAADDIDLDAIDAAMGEEEAEQAENIDMEEMKDALSEDSEAKANKAGAAKPQATEKVTASVEAAKEEVKVAVEENTIAVNGAAAAKSQKKKSSNNSDDNEDEGVVRQQPRKRVQFSEPQADALAIGFDTQLAFLSNCAYDFIAGKHRVLSWNTVGVVGIRSEFQYTVVDIEFTNRNFHRNLSINDDFNVSMAAMNYNGVLLASQAEQKDEDQYEDDIADDDEMADEMFKRRKSSNIQYKPFNEWKDVKEWNYELKNQESVECLAVGSGWNAVLTNYNYIRIFSNNGIQKDLICQAHPVVTMAGYENFLALVYQSGPAFCGYQPMRLKIVNIATRDNRVLLDSDCPVTPTSELKWFGFSEEGQLFSYDSLGIVRSFSFTTQTWTPRHDFKIKNGHIYRQLWIAGISDQELLVIEMPKDHEAPSFALKSNVRRFKMRQPLLDQNIEGAANGDKDESLPQIEAKVQNIWLHLDHEIFRKQNWESLKHFRSKYDNEFALSETIMDNSEIVELKKSMDKECLNAIRLCVMANESEKVFDYMDMLHFSASLKLVAKMCDKLKAQDLAQKVSKFISDKDTRDVFMKQQLPQDKRPLGAAGASGASNNMLGRRVQANAAPVSFSEQFKNEKPQLLGSSQVSNATTVAPQLKRIEAKTNPFQKKAVQATQPVGTQQNAAATDVFSDLNKTNGNSKLDQASASLLQKRTNPFANTTAQPTKQRKLFKNSNH